MDTLFSSCDLQYVPHYIFRLIVVAEKKIVYKQFPIPLINRMEKHILATTSMLSPAQLKIVQNLNRWAKDFVTVTPLMTGGGQKTQVVQEGDVFIGFHSDATASVVLQVCKDHPFTEGENERDWSYKVKSIPK